VVDERLRGASAAHRWALAASPYHRYMLAAERRLYASRRLQRVICISQMVQTEIHERFGLPRERLPVIYNAIDPAAFHPGLTMHRSEVRARLGIADDACVFLLVGSASRNGVTVVGAVMGEPSEAARELEAFNATAHPVPDTTLTAPNSPIARVTWWPSP